MFAPLLIAALLSPDANAWRPQRDSSHPIAVVRYRLKSSRYLLKIGGSDIDVEIQLQPSFVQTDDVLSWVRRAAESVAIYYGQFPIRRVRVYVTQTEDDDESIHGTTWGGIEGFQGVTRMRLGRSVSAADLAADWTMTHELVHMGIASLADEHHWFEEGLATYVEPIARVQDGHLSAERLWNGMVSGMSQGEPQRGDQGIDRTHTWGRTYWGGAIFCLVADVEIHQATANRKGLQDALRAIVIAGATIDTESALPPILRIGDQATGTTVLTDLYQGWKDTPVSVNLDQLWGELGVRSGPRGVDFDNEAPLAQIRRAITSSPLQSNPSQESNR
jgi:hypothetical protein